MTYTNNDYGKGLSDSFISNFEAGGGTVTLSAPHEDGKADYSAEIGALASAGGEVLAVLGYADQGGKGMIQAALDTGAFDTFMMGDGMFADSLMADSGRRHDRQLRRGALVRRRRRRRVQGDHRGGRRRWRQLIHPRKL